MNINATPHPPDNKFLKYNTYSSSRIAAEKIEDKQRYTLAEDSI